MFAKPEAPAKPGQIESILGKGLQVKGTIYSKGTLRIDGTCEGTIESEADVIVGESAALNSDIKARNVTVGGTVTGNIAVSGRLEILQTGRVKGDVHVGTIVISEGGLFQGNCTMESNSKEPETKLYQKPQNAVATPKVEPPKK
ncbi:MAG TPA: polymer-forming cytoskeletal protein [Firmicutes bacterium]|nr:polymer-forming cytoskeletal protein [Candidatus Fermentithermobacillaceae bacterium]